MPKKLNLRTLRIDKGISATHIAKILGISRQTLSNKENGKCGWTALEVQKLCEIYDVQISQLKLA